MGFTKPSYISTSAGEILAAGQDRNNCGIFKGWDDYWW